MLSSHRFHASLMRAYDVRGIVNLTLFAEDAYYFGQVFATEVFNQTGHATICVGYDGRLSSPVLAEALIDGLMASGAEVVPIGLGPTPMLYYAAHQFNANGGLMITGSHNPPNYNGIKCVIDDRPFFGEQLQGLATMAAAGQWRTHPGGLHPDASHIATEYTRRLAAEKPQCHDLKIVWDPGNGAAGNIIETLVTQLPGTHTVINATIDGNFPNHHPDPSIHENMLQLINTVRQQGADIGLAFDGDGDRLGIIDRTGHLWRGDQLAALFAWDIANQSPEATILMDVKSSHYLETFLEKQSCTPLICKTGHSHIKAKMREIKATFAGEASGHYFFADRYEGYDDGLYAAVRLLELVGRRKLDLATWYAQLPVTEDSGEVQIACPEADKITIISKIKHHLVEAGGKFSDLDGVRVVTSQGWWLIRASNTQAVLIVRVESHDPASFLRLRQQVTEMLAKVGLAYPVST
jgi:phosphomannomutase